MIWIVRGVAFGLAVAYGWAVPGFVLAALAVAAGVSYCLRRNPRASATGAIIVAMLYAALIPSIIGVTASFLMPKPMVRSSSH